MSVEPRDVRRWPFDPVVRLIDLRWRCPNAYVSHIGIDGRASRVLGVSRSTIHRWRRGGLTCRTADRVAIALNLHPAILWPDWLDDVSGVVDANDDATSTTEDLGSDTDRWVAVDDIAGVPVGFVAVPLDPDRCVVAQAVLAGEGDQFSKCERRIGHGAITLHEAVI